MNWLLYASLTLLGLSCVGFGLRAAEAYEGDYFGVCREWRELTSPWVGYSCWEHGGFPVCVPTNTTSSIARECKTP